MLPVLFYVGPFAVTSFGLFVALGFILAVFMVWRLARVYDVNESKLIDLAIFTFLGALISARLFFVATHLNMFADISRIPLITRYPGLSFWGGLIGGMIVFKLVLLKSKISFWQIADFACAGLLLALAIGDIGCFLSGCVYGVASNLPFAFPVAGILDKRLPVSLFEAGIFLLLFSYIWGQVIRFHFAGKITALTLIFIGCVKFISEFWLGDRQYFYYGFSYGTAFSLILIIAGLIIFYRCSKRSILEDLAFLGSLFTSSKKRELVTTTFQKTWYNHKVSLKIKSEKVIKFLKRRSNVKPTPEQYRQD